MGISRARTFGVCLRGFCADSSSPQISTILVGHVTGENDSLRKSPRFFAKHSQQVDTSQHTGSLNSLVITAINRIAVITTINRIAIITTINRIAVITTINRIAIITTINRIAVITIITCWPHHITVLRDPIMASRSRRSTCVYDNIL